MQISQWFSKKVSKYKCFHCNKWCWRKLVIDGRPYRYCLTDEFKLRALHLSNAHKKVKNQQ